MNFDDELLDENSEVGSDNLLSDDNLRLPDSANALVRLHAVRSWLRRLQREANIEIGEAALSLQQIAVAKPQERPRRRERLGHMEHIQQAQQTFEKAQERLEAFEKAGELLEECISHTTSGERVLVEYYLAEEELIQDID